jgi:hypothetical protein
MFLHFFVLNIEQISRPSMECEVRGRRYQAKACKASGAVAYRPITASAHK